MRSSIWMACCCVLLACGAGQDGTGASTAKLVMPLVATGGTGTTYRLSPARFRVQGAGVNRVEDGGGVDTLSVDLPPGAYLVTLLANWALNEVGPEGDTPVEAVLQSANPQTLNISEGAVTNLVFRFGVGDDAIAFGNGRGEISIEVDDGCTPQPFFADTDGDGFGDPSVSQTACEAPQDFVDDNGDCNDSDAGVNPAATEICDSLDNDCDGAIDGPAACQRRVFQTSSQHTGDLGGLAGADQICQQLADVQALGGSWRAWLSDSTTNAVDRLNPNAGPFVRLDAAVVADDIADLTDGSLQNPIDLNQSGVQMAVAAIWTGTLANGTAGGGNCVDWTNSVIFGAGRGQNNSTSSIWTQLGAARCDFTYSLYCFEH